MLYIDRKTGGKMKVLIIDDDYTVLNLAKNILGKIYQTFTAKKPVEGLRILKETRIDLILLDWMLPQMDGLEVLRLLQEDEATAHIPVIFLSEKHEDDDIARALAAGAKEFIKKPLSRESLLSTIHSYTILGDLDIASESA